LGWKQDRRLTRHTKTYVQSGFLSLQMLVDKYILYQKREDMDPALAFRATFPRSRLDRLAKGWSDTTLNETYTRLRNDMRDRQCICTD
jgi:hypothetical protein